MSNQRGFSLLELVLAAGLTATMALMMGSFLIGRMQDFARSESEQTAQQNTKAAMELLVQIAKGAQSIEIANRWPDNNGPGGTANPYSWSSNTANPATIVLAVPAVNAANQPLYADSFRNTLETNDVVLYYDPATKSIWRRTLADPVSGNAAKTTCPPAKATTSCPADSRMVNQVAGLTVAYLTANNQPTTSPELASALKITLTQQIKRGSKTYSSNLTTQVSLRN